MRKRKHLTVAVQAGGAQRKREADARTVNEEWKERKVVPRIGAKHLLSVFSHGTNRSQERQQTYDGDTGACGSMEKRGDEMHDEYNTTSPAEDITGLLPATAGVLLSPRRSTSSLTRSLPPHSGNPARPENVHWQGGASRRLRTSIHSIKEMIMRKIALVAGLCCFLVAAASAGDPPDLETVLASPPGIEKGLLEKLAGCDSCARAEAAFLLGCRKCPEAVIPLMGMLHSGTSEQCRIVAALSLCLLGDKRGTYAVKRAATFDPSPKVRTLCAWFYDRYFQTGSFAFVTQGPVPQNLAARGK